MDVLVNKNKKDYNYTSRYASIPFYYHTQDRKYVYGITKQLSSDTNYLIHEVRDTDDLDKLALKYYGRPDLFWVIAEYNRIRDPYINLSEYYNYVYIPALADIRWK